MSKNSTYKYFKRLLEDIKDLRDISWTQTERYNTIKMSIKSPQLNL